MARPKTKDYWEEGIRILTEEDPRLGPLGVRSQLIKLVEADAEGKAGPLRVPSLRTIGRIQRQFRPLPEEERRPYRIFRWPESFERGDLPWEAQGAALELMRVWARGPRLGMVSPEARRLLSPAARPSVRLARWFWRMTQAAPDATALERRHIAGLLAAAEAGDPDVRRAAEGWLCYAPWRSEEARGAYEEAQAEGRIPHFQFTVREGARADALLELVGGYRFGRDPCIHKEAGEPSGLAPEGEES
jgi:hypothetical protein